MKKFLIALFLLLCLIVSPTFVARADVGTRTFVVSANAAVVFETADLTSEKLETLNYGTLVEVATEDGSAKVFENSSYKFYFVTHNETSGYVIMDLLTPQGQTITAIPNFNGKTNAACPVYRLEGENYVETGISLEKKQKIFLYEGYNRKKEFTAISFVYENEVMYGYIKTSAVDPNGINPIIITCICLIAAILGITFAWMFIKGKKKKKK